MGFTTATSIPRISLSIRTTNGENGRRSGLFLSEPVVEQLISSKARRAPLHVALPKRAPRPEHKAVTYLRCPCCNQMMSRKVFGRVSGVIVDICRLHGVWFDAGELTAVIEFVERGGLDEQRKCEQEDDQRLQEQRQRLEKIPWEEPRRGWGGSHSFALELAKAWLEW